MLDVRARSRADRLLHPVGRVLAWLRITPTMLTVAGLACTVAGAILVGRGLLIGGALLVAAGGTLDALDGLVARITGTASEAGAFLDSVTDRLGETAMWAGLAYFVAGQPRQVVLVVLALGGSLLVSYLRSRAESSGVQGRGGWLGRSERVIIYSVGVGTGYVVPMLWVVVVGSALTAIQRFRVARGQLVE